MLRDPVKVQFLWADAVCINQSNEEERGHQVKLMGWIFGNTVRVVVWLGEASTGDLCYKYVIDEFFDDDNDEGQAALAAFDTFVYEAYTSREGTLKPSKLSLVRPEDLDHSMHEIWTAFARLLDHPWFTRLWVVQEVGMGKSVVALTGNATIDFISLMEVVYSASYSKFLTDYFSMDTGKIDNFYDFLDILELARSQLASDPRDYIYALLGHPSALLHGIPIVEPDYNKSEGDLFFEHENDLGGEYSSWIPTWTRDGFERAIAVNQHRSRSYAAAIGAPAFWKITTPGKVLHVRGFIFDVIEEYSRTVEYTTIRTSITEACAGKVWPDVFHFKTRKLISIRENLHDIAQTLAAGYKPDTSLSQHLANFAAFRLHLIKQSFGQSDGTTSDFAPEGMTELQIAAEHGHVDDFFSDVGSICLGKKLFSTQSGMLGLSPSVSREGDLCCILFGASVPIILRPVKLGYRTANYAIIDRATFTVSPYSVVLDNADYINPDKS
ncbi:hypothetical protein B7463_g12505, partial [Scytalidium lignicola]